jgi:hypothetical protein
MKRSLSILVAMCAASILASAQMPPMPKPGPEIKKLEYFTGSWTCDGDNKPGPMGPGGKMTMTEESKWMDGGFFVVTHSQFKSSDMGNGSGAAVLGYDLDEKKYTYDEFNSMGERVHAKGTVDGDAWTWTSDMKMGPQTMTGRFSEKILSPAAYTIKFEVSPDGTNWTLVMDGKCTKK